MAKEDHRHSCPSPSHAVGAWCQGAEEDWGCGKFVPLYEFRDRRQDEGPHESYFIDSRDPAALLEAIETYVEHAGRFPQSDFRNRLRKAVESL